MKREKIVVIEDVPDIAELIEYHLVPRGYDVSTSLQGNEGLAWVQKDPPDLIILDLLMPGMNGMDVLARLKSNPPTAYIPVIVISARTRPSDVIAALEAGADDYVRKPFAPRELVARVRAALRRARAIPPSASPVARA